VGLAELILSIAWLVCVGWLLLRAFRQNGALPRLEPISADRVEAARVAVIVPARDEEANIGACLASLAAQTYPCELFDILVVDDHSSDATAQIVTAHATERPCLALTRSPPLPDQWVGKCHACWVGACAVAAAAEWLCFVDADVRAEPSLIATAVAAAKARELDFLSLTPKQELRSFAERLVMPCGFYLLAFRQDLRAVQAPESSEAVATGQFILVRSSVYFGLGGHSAVRSEICEDVELAKLIKRSGGRVALAGGDRLITTRMYDGWRSLWLGVSKNLVNMLGGPFSTWATLICAICLVWAAVVLPTLDAVGCARENGLACAALAAAVPASAATFALHVAGAIFFRIPFWYGLLFPFGYSAGALMALDSVRRRATGRISWKGRTYP
jgi:chlorobactene glucosyltransferase